MKERTDPPRDRDTDGRAAALAAFDRRDDGAHLAGLTEQPPPRPSAARADHDAVTASLRFDHDDLALSVRVHAPAPGPQGPADRSVHGQITGHVDEADLRARRPGRSFGVRVGADGRFALTGLDRGPLSLEVRRPGRAPVITAWFTV